MPCQKNCVAEHTVEWFRISSPRLGETSFAMRNEVLALTLGRRLLLGSLHCTNHIRAQPTSALRPGKFQ